MERLTWECELDGFTDIGLRDGVTVDVAICRLSAYERTGLEPEEILRILDAYGRGMTLRTESAQRLEIVKDIQTDRLRKLAQADREGRCVVLPCGPGQVVWAANSFGVSSHQIRILVRDKDGDFACSMIKFPLEDFGRKVFLTREEAQAALRREQA